MNQIVNFLTDMAADPAMQHQFANDPQALFASSEFSDEVREALLAGDRTQISDLVAASLPVSHMTAVSCNSFFADPGPDPDSDPDPWPND